MFGTRVRVSHNNVPVEFLIIRNGPFGGITGAEGGA
jgi:hypothetical protein